MAELRHIEIPETVKLLGATPYPFVDCVDFLISTDHRFNDNGNGIRAGAEIKAEMKGKKPHDRATLDEPNWRLLHEVMEEPHGAEQGKKIGKWGVFTQTAKDAAGKDVIVGEYIVPGGEFLPYLDAVSEKATQAVAEQMKVEAKQEAKADPKKKPKPIPDAIKAPPKAAPSKSVNGRASAS